MCEREYKCEYECERELACMCVFVNVRTDRQACTTTISLFLCELCLTVSCTSPRGYWLGAEPLQRDRE